MTKFKRHDRVRTKSIGGDLGPLRDKLGTVIDVDGPYYKIRFDDHQGIPGTLHGLYQPLTAGVWWHSRNLDKGRDHPVTLREAWT